MVTRVCFSCLSTCVPRSNTALPCLDCNLVTGEQFLSTLLLTRFPLSRTQCLHFNTIQTPEGERTNQSVPIVLPCTTEEKAKIDGQEAIALAYEGNIVAILAKPETYDAIKEERWSVTPSCSCLFFFFSVYLPTVTVCACALVILCQRPSVSTHLHVPLLP